MGAYWRVFNIVMLVSNLGIYGISGWPPNLFCAGFLAGLLFFDIVLAFAQRES